MNGFVSGNEEWKDKIKPCPFCGSGMIEFMNTLDYKESHVITKLRCYMCGGMIPFQDSVEKAVEAWNKRVQA